MDISEQGSISSFSNHSQYSSRLMTASSPLDVGDDDDDDDDDIEQGSTTTTSLYDDPVDVAAVAPKQKERAPRATSRLSTATTQAAPTTRTLSSQDGVMSAPESTSAFHRFFQLEERNTSVRQEFRAATISFLSLSYILIVNKTLLGNTGVVHVDGAVFGTALSSAAACFVVGLLGNVPFGMVPHVGLSSFLVHGLFLAEILTLQEVFVACWLSGLLVLGIALVPGVGSFLIRIAPQSYRLGITAGMGLLVSLNALVSVGIITVGGSGGSRSSASGSENNTSQQPLLALGDDAFSDWTLVMCMIGILGMATLFHYGWITSTWIAMSVMALIYWEGMDEWPSRWMGGPSTVNTPVQFEILTSLSSLHALQFTVTVVTLVLVILYDVTGVGLGLVAAASTNKNKNDDNNNNNNNNNTTTSSSIGKRTTIRSTLIASAIGTMIGAFLGSTPMTVATESVLGIQHNKQRGGRTGLTAIFMGLFFLLTILCCPLLASFPAVAAVAVLVVAVGVKYTSEAAHIRWNSLIEEALPAFVVLVMIPFTSSISTGMILGYVCFLWFYVTTGRICTDLSHVSGIFQQRQGRRRLLLGVGTYSTPRRERLHSNSATADEQSVAARITRSQQEDHLPTFTTTTTTVSHQKSTTARVSSSAAMTTESMDDSASSSQSNNVWSSSLPSTLRLRRRAGSSMEDENNEQDGLLQQPQVAVEDEEQQQSTTLQQQKQEVQPSVELSDTLSLESSSSSENNEIFEDDKEESSSSDDDDDDDDKSHEDLSSSRSAEAHVSPV